MNLPDFPHLFQTLFLFGIHYGIGRHRRGLVDFLQGLAVVRKIQSARVIPFTPLSNAAFSVPFLKSPKCVLRLCLVEFPRLSLVGLQLGSQLRR